MSGMDAKPRLPAPVRVAVGVIGYFMAGILVASALAALMMLASFESASNRELRIIAATLAGACLFAAVWGARESFLARLNPWIHCAAALIVLRYAASLFGTDDTSAVTRAVQVGAAVALLPLVWSTILRAFGSTAAVRGAFAPSITRLNWLGIATPGVTTVVLTSLYWDLVGVVIILAGAAVSLGFFAASATRAIAGARRDPAVGPRRFRQAFVVAVLFVGACVVAAVNSYPLTAALQRAARGRNGESSKADAREVTRLSAADVRALRASRFELQYWGGYCCIASADERRLAYVKSEPGRETIYVDDRPIAVFLFRDQMSFSPDGRHFAAIGRVSIDAEPLLYLDGEPLAGAPGGVVGFVFSPDSRRLIHVVQSPTSRRFVAVLGSLIEEGGKVALADPQPLVESESLLTDSFQFSPDGAHTLFIDGPEIVTTPRGAHLEHRYYLVLDGNRRLLASAPPEDRGTPMAFFSDQGPYVCTLRRTGDEAAAPMAERVFDLTDNEVDIDSQAVCHAPPADVSRTWSSSDPWRATELDAAGHQARIEQDGVLERLVVDERPQPSFDKVWPPWFRRDGREVRYGAVDGDRMVWVRSDLEARR